MISKFSPSKKLEYKMEFDTLDNDGKFGTYAVNKIHENYKGRLDIFEDQGKGKPYAGSSTLGIFAVDELARGEAGVMLPEESEFLLFRNMMPEKTTTYKDLGVTMDFTGKNHELAVHLYNMLLGEHKDFDLFPAILTGLVTRLNDRIGDYGLALEKSDKYPYGLTTAKILARPKGNFSKDDPNLIIEGVPSKLQAGERTLHTSSQKEQSIDNLGLSRFVLFGGSVLDSYVDGLAPSDSDGRVVLVREELKEK